MGLEDIHSWSDDETITHDDLNSIKAAVAQELTARGGIQWPLLARGNIDMNGYSIRNIASILGTVRVNDSNPLESALSAASDGDVLILEPGSTHSISDFTLSGKSNITLQGYGQVEVAVPSSITAFGLKVDTSCSGIIIDGLVFTGGATNKPAVEILGGQGHKVLDCTFESVHGLNLGDASTFVSRATVSGVHFVGCTIGLWLRGSKEGIFSDLHFSGCTYGLRLSDSTTGSAFYGNAISNATFSTCTYAMYAAGGYIFSDTYARNTVTNAVTVSCDTSISIGGLKAMAFCNCVLDGNVTCIVEDAKFSNNSFFGEVEFLSTARGTYTGNTFRNEITWFNAGAYNVIVGNYFSPGYNIDGITSTVMTGNYPPV